MIDIVKKHHAYKLALVASAALVLGACSKGNAPLEQPNATAPVQVGVAPAQTQPAQPVVVAQNNSAYEQGRRDQHRDDRRHERADVQPPPRADRDGYNGSNVRDDQQHWRDQQQVAAASACNECGVVESIAPVNVAGQANGLGAVAGGVGGALIGNRVAGRNDRAIGGVIGAIGGGLLGNAIEKHERASTAYDVNVRMNDGSMRTVRQATSPVVGQKVRIEADGLHDRS